MEKVAQKTCFLIVPFGNPTANSDRDKVIAQHAQCVKDWVVKATADQGYKVIRGDDPLLPDNVLQQVLKEIIDADLVIADVSYLNPNVTYEVAIRHASERPCIVLIQRKEKCPFNLQGLRLIHIDTTQSDSEERTVREIRKVIEEIQHVSSFNRPARVWGDVHDRLRAALVPEVREVDTLTKVEQGIRQIDIRTQDIERLLRSEQRGADTIFRERLEHYGKEKDLLAERFLDSVLRKRIEYLKSKGQKKINIVFDAGTTIAPMVHVISREASKQGDHWCRDLHLITNSIKAVEYMLGYRAFGGQNKSRYAKLPVEHFSVLPGTVLAAYEAIADEKTMQALEQLKADGGYTIAVTTGNYVLMRDRAFLPIARAGFHPDFKGTLYDIAQEVYVIAPLGKILFWADTPPHLTPYKGLEDMLSELNTRLKFQPNPPSDENKQYQLVTEKVAWQHGKPKAISEPEIKHWLEKTVLVTTSRPAGALFHRHSESVAEKVYSLYTNDWSPSSGPRRWSTPFDPLLPSLAAQFESEVPHNNLKPYAKEFFQIPADFEIPKMEREGAEGNVPRNIERLK